MLFRSGAFIKTTLAPVIIMLIVNLIVIIRMMQHTPLQFLRHDLKKTKRKKAMRLPRWSFMSRFRLRIMFQNVANYLILFVGIFFIMVMLAMAVGMPDTLDYYKKNTDSMMFAKYQYVLKSYVDADGNVLETDNSDAEKFDMTSLLRRTDEFDEEVSVYGVETDSAYVKLKDMDSLKDNEVYISDSFADKYGIKPGDTIKLDAQYEKKTYKFKVKGTYDKSQSIAVFMPIEHFADTFDFADGRFSGFFSAFGKALSRTEMQRLVSLYLNDGWQPDVVLLCCAEVARQGRRTVGALSRELLKWRDAGVETGEDAERYLKQQAQRESWCIESAALFGIAPAQLSRWERGAIARWHEDWRFGADMIEEALLRADNHRTVRYVDGILRSWYAQGLTTVSAVRGQGQLAGSNILTTGAKPAAPKTDLFQTNWNDVFDDDTEG